MRVLLYLQAMHGGSKEGGGVTSNLSAHIRRQRHQPQLLTVALRTYQSAQLAVPERLSQAQSTNLHQNNSMMYVYATSINTFYNNQFY